MMDYGGPVRPRGAVQSSGPVRPGGAVQSSGPVHAGGPVRPGGAVQSSGPVRPGGAVQSSGPVRPGGAVQSSGPVRPGGAVQSSGPVRPGGAVQSSGPVRPGGAVQSSGPVHPGDPGQSSEQVHPIEAESYRIVRSRIDLSYLPPLSRAVTERVIHASADFDYATDLVCDEAALAAGVAALAAGAPVVVDVAMVAAGITARPVICKIGEPLATRLSRTVGITRSAAAIRLAFGEAGAGAVWVIGCAPTAVAEILSRDVEPALVIGLPVGFVGAAEAKDALRASGLPALTNKSEKGGSAVAAAALNALLRVIPPLASASPRADRGHGPGVTGSADRGAAQGGAPDAWQGGAPDAGQGGRPGAVGHAGRAARPGEGAGAEGTPAPGSGRGGGQRERLSRGGGEQ